VMVSANKWAMGYITAVLIANYTAVWFIPFPVFGAVAVGTLVFGATFTARDYVHRLGRPRVYTMIGVASLSAAGLSVVGAVDWRIIVASVIAIILSETADTEIYQQLMSQRWIVRVAGSNAISVPMDTALFNLIAFAGVFSWPMLASIMFGEIIVKYGVGVVVALWRYRN